MKIGMTCRLPGTDQRRVHDTGEKIETSRMKFGARDKKSLGVLRVKRASDAPLEKQTVARPDPEAKAAENALAALAAAGAEVVPFEEHAAAELGTGPSGSRGAGSGAAQGRR